MFEEETESSLVQKLREKIDCLHAELEAVTLAADRNSVQLSKVTRQNREYLECIKELKEQLANAKSTKITDRTYLGIESSNELLSLIGDEDYESRKRLTSDSELTDDPLVVHWRLRKRRKRRIKKSDTSSSNDEDLNKSNHQAPFGGLPICENSPPWTPKTLRTRSEIGKFIRTKVEQSKFGKGRTICIIHECKCWVLIRAAIGKPMFLFRKGEPAEHEKHCQAAVKSGNEFFKLTNCDERQIVTGEKGYEGMKWCEMFGYKPVHKFPEFADSSDVEYFQDWRRLEFC